MSPAVTIVKYSIDYELVCTLSRDQFSLMAQGYENKTQLDCYSIETVKRKLISWFDLCYTFYYSLITIETSKICRCCHRQHDIQLYSRGKWIYSMARYESSITTLIGLLCLWYRWYTTWWIAYHRYKSSTSCCTSVYVCLWSWRNHFLHNMPHLQYCF